MKRPTPFESTGEVRPAFGLEPSVGRPSPPVPAAPVRAPARFTDTGPVRPGGQLGPYVVQSEIARGGMGVVYRARHTGLQREVALKVLPLGALAGHDELERFRLEARAAARLRHPNVVTVHDVGESDGVVYLAMDLVEGRSLGERVDAGPLEPREAAELCAKVADGLHHAHAQGILHRDLKPGNVLVTPSGEPMLVDFGLAKFVDTGEEGKGKGKGTDGPTRTGQLLGTPAYMAPEQARGVYADARTDVYGLGATLYSALTGAVPFDASNLMMLLYQVVNKEVPRPSTLRPGLDRDLETICLTCMEKEPARRYPSAEELALDLRRWLRGDAIRARPPTRGERLARWVRRNRVAAAAAAYAIGLVVVGGTLATVWAVQRSAAEDVRAAETRRLALEEARGGLVAEAKKGSQRAWAALGREGSRPLDAALRALQAAQRWHDLAPEDAAAAKARFDAALALGEVARAHDQLDLALEAFGQADGLRVDDARARALRAEVTDAREAAGQRRRAEVARWLDAAASGDLARRPDGLAEAVLRIVRWPEPDTVDALVARLTAITAKLRSAEGDLLLAAGRQGSSIEGLGRDVHVRRARALASAPGARPGWLHLLAAKQRLTLTPGEVDVARVACDALGWIGLRAPAEPALVDYLDAEADEHRASTAAVALARLSGDTDHGAVTRARERFGHGPLAERVATCALGDAPVSPAVSSVAAVGDTPIKTIAARIEELAAAVAREPDHLDGWVTLGELRHGEGDLAGARAAFDHALALEPCDVGALVGRSLVLAEQGESARALADADRAVALRDDLASAWAARGCVQPDPARARADCERALALDDALVAGWLGLGAARLALDDARGATEAWSRALELDPTHVTAWADLARARRGQGDLAGALTAADRALALAQDDPRVWSLRARLREMSDDRKGAVEDLGRALALAPGRADLLVERARVRKDQGDTPGAIADLEAILKLSPIPREAALARERLDELRAPPCEKPGAPAKPGP